MTSQLTFSCHLATGFLMPAPWSKVSLLSFRVVSIILYLKNVYTVKKINKNWREKWVSKFSITEEMSCLKIIFIVGFILSYWYYAQYLKCFQNDNNWPLEKIYFIIIYHLSFNVVTALCLGSNFKRYFHRMWKSSLLNVLYINEATSQLCRKHNINIKVCKLPVYFYNVIFVISEELIFSLRYLLKFCHHRDD